MKKSIIEFIRRGLISSSFGPLVLVILYLILHRQNYLQTLTVHEVCVGIVSLTLLAFIAGGMNVIYQIEQLPLMVAIFIHGAVLYVSYLATYLLNGWLKSGLTPFLLFSVIFLFGYLAIWVVIYTINKRNTEKINTLLENQQKNRESGP